MQRQPCFHSRWNLSAVTSWQPCLCVRSDQVRGSVVPAFGKCKTTETDIISNKSYTLPFSHRRNISHLALNPRGNLLLSVDEDGRAILANFPRRLAIHHFSFKAPVSALTFSPSGRHFAAGIGRFAEVWKTPSTPDASTDEGLEYAPFVRHRVYAGHYDTVKCIEWSSDSRFFLSSAKDLTARIWSLDPEEGFVPTALAGHREGVLGAWFSSDQEQVSGKSWRPYNRISDQARSTQ